jgi:prepilin signal peptidase PulO-like enzyme (type II secretory pathway)
MSFELIAAALIIGFGIPSIISDIRSQNIANGLTFGFSGAAIGAVLVGSLILDVNITAAVSGGVGAFVLYLALYFLSKGSLGEADVKLSLGFGFLLGAISIQMLMGWILLSFLIAGIFAGVALATRKMHRRQSFAYAPFMFSSAIMVLAVLR